MRNNKEIDSILKSVLKESLTKKVSKVAKTIKESLTEDDLSDYIKRDHVDESKQVCEQCGSDLTEGECLECGMKGSYEEEYEMMEDEDISDDYVMDKIERECQEDPQSVGCIKHKQYAGISNGEEIDEELHGNQKRLDVAKPKGKLTSADFKKLRSMKNEESEEMDEGIGYYDNIDSDYFHEKTGGMYNPKMKDIEEPETEDVTFKERKPVGDIEDIKPENKKQSFFGKMKKRLGFSEAETEEGNAFTGALAKAREEGDDSFEVDGKKYNTKESVKSKLTLTETELIDLIESIIIEEQEKKVIDRKKPKGLTEYEKNVKLSKKQNDDYIKSVTKKMKEYMKDGSKEDFTMDAKHFPKNNGQLVKMDKKAYKPSEAVEEYIEEFAYGGGMENLDYDEIKPNDEWLKMNIEGDSKTGNSQEYANAEKTDLGKKINKRREKNLFNINKKGSYKRVKQPVDTAGESDGEKSLDKMFKELSENNTPKEEKILNEEIGKIGNLMTYNRKTQ